MQPDLLFKLDQNPEGAGLRCDSDGLFLGRDALLRRDGDGEFEARAAPELTGVFGRIYGDGTNWGSRIRSVTLVADALNKGEMARAMMVAVLMRLPEPTGVICIAEVDGVLAKGFDPDEPRDERGRWTSGGSESSDSSPGHRSVGTQLADADPSDAFRDPVTQAAARAAEAEPNTRPNTLLAAADDEDEKDPRFGICGNNPPLSELLPPRLLQSPAGPPIQFLDNLLDISGPGNEANLEWAELQMKGLLYQIRKVDPNYVYQSMEPEGGLAVMSWDARLNVINGLKADLAAAIYRIKGDIKPLQEVTFEFMQQATNTAYDEGVKQYDAGELDKSLSREVAIGRFVDGWVRQQLRQFYNGLNISTDADAVIRVNSRTYNSSVSPETYRIPDARVGNFAFDVSLKAKRPSNDQIKGFFSADFQPTGVVIVRPNQLGNNSSYIIWRWK